MATKDRWATWLESMREPGDADVRRMAADMLAGFRERVLDNAQLAAGETLLDVGSGEGLIAFGALDRGAGTVVFSDISRDLLDFCREAADERGMLDRCRFVEAPADDLAGIEDASVDVVTTRSVLIYVADKARAFREFARVLRPGGRISLFEPINRFARHDDASFAGYDLSPLPEIAAKIRAVHDELQPPETDPMLDFDERDLVAHAEGAGFHPVRLVLEAEIRPSDPVPWDVFVSRAGNPRVPTVAEVMSQALTEDERRTLEAHLRPLVEEGRGTWRMASAYLSGVKPADAGLD